MLEASHTRSIPSLNQGDIVKMDKLVGGITSDKCIYQTLVMILVDDSLAYDSPESIDDICCLEVGSQVPPYDGQFTIPFYRSVARLDFLGFNGSIINPHIINPAMKEALV